MSGVDNDGTAPRQIAVCHTYEQLRDAIAAFCSHRGVTRQALDRRAGLADGHSSKLLSPKAAMKFGPVSLRWILAALDLEIVLQVRPDAAMNTKQQNHAGANAGERKPARQDWRRNRGTRWGQRMRARQLLQMTAEQRSASARRAAAVRWHPNPFAGTALTED